MQKMKITAAAILVCGSSTVFSGTMGPVCKPDNVTVPCEQTGFDLGIYALYLKPTYSANAAFAGVNVSPGNEVVYNQFNEDWNWGFRLDASYHFSTGNDLTASWYHFKGDTTHSFTNALLPGDTLATSLRSTAEPKWDAVNVEFGQHADFGVFKDIRFHAGVQYARINTNLHSTANILNSGAGNFNKDMRFKGIGPRVGSDMTYNIGHGFAVYGNGAAALLIGTQESSGQIVTEALPTRSKNRVVVPELDAKLGMKYGHNMAQGTLTVDAGWMAVNYFNVHRSIVATTDSTNFALNGPYVGLKYVGNV